MAKRAVSVRFEHVQVDICPHEAGMILSVGAISMWLPEPTVREVVSKLQAGLASRRRRSPGVRRESTSTTRTDEL